MPRKFFLVLIFLLGARAVVGQPVALACALELVIGAATVVEHNPLTNEKFRTRPFTLVLRNRSTAIALSII